MNNAIGLAQGFVRFGSMAHHVLLKMHELGDMRYTDLVTEMPDEVPRAIGTAIDRLRKHKFIHRKDLATKYVTGEKTQWLYSLGPKTNKDGYKHRPATNAEKAARYRANQAALRRRVPSVFEFRGEIHV